MIRSSCSWSSFIFCGIFFPPSLSVVCHIKKAVFLILVALVSHQCTESLVCCHGVASVSYTHLMALYWNDMADILGSRAGIYLERFETAGIQGEDVSRLIFLIYLGIAAAVCGFLILKLKFYLLVLAWALVLPILSGILGMEPDAGTGVKMCIRDRGTRITRAWWNC